MHHIRHVQMEDEAFWFRLDRHLTREAFARKVRDKSGYVLLADGAPVGLLRYSLFWDQIPFCNLLYIERAQQNKGYGSALTARWEQDMRALGHCLLLTSTQADETAQHFYRKLGYRDCGNMLLDFSPYRQPMELLLGKPI